MFVALVAAFGTESAMAGTAGGGALPWEGALNTLVASLTGPVAIAISIIAIFVCGAILVFGGEMGDFARRMVMVILGVAVIGFAAQLVTSFFGLTAAVVG